jgi:hypothetical protein
MKYVSNLSAIFTLNKYKLLLYNKGTMDINAGIINLEIPIDDLSKLDSLDLSQFSNGLLVFHIYYNDYFPIVYRLKRLDSADLQDIINKLIVELSSINTTDRPVKFIHGYNMISTNLIYFRLI